MGDMTRMRPFALGVTNDSVYPTEQDVIKAGDFLPGSTPTASATSAKARTLTPDDPRFPAPRAGVFRQRGEALLDALLSQARHFANRERFLDDVCLVGIEIERLT